MAKLVLEYTPETSEIAMEAEGDVDTISGMVAQALITIGESSEVGPWQMMHRIALQLETMLQEEAQEDVSGQVIDLMSARTAE